MNISCYLVARLTSVPSKEFTVIILYNSCNKNSAPGKSLWMEPALRLLWWDGAMALLKGLKDEGRAELCCKAHHGAAGL